MPPLPKRKTSHARQGERRSHLEAKTSAMVPCPQCHEMRLPHRACPSCGYYRGKKVVETTAESK
ncbi:MAG: 50S ribosomal protein L32 [Chloroflexi bacterium]|nr:50S ribosomal protein L32 [Chloroflexota bacterium]MCL5108118.1 50S ribosomal protein L32 [Chloroflexota bacterium]